MARNGGGVYSLPGTYEAVAGETILAAQHNDPLEDLEQDMNTARPIVAGGTGGTTAAAARTNLAVPGLADANAFTGVNSFSEMVKLSLGTAIDDDDVDGSNILTLPTDGNTFVFTGTQQVDEIATVGVGTTVRFRHGTNRTFTHDATNLICPGGADLTVASGAVTEWHEYAAGDWECVRYQPAAGIGWEDLGTTPVSGGTSLTKGSLGPFRIIRAIGFLRPDTDSQQILLQTSTDGGSSYATSSGNYSVQAGRANISSVDAAGNSTQAGMLIGATSLGNLSTEGVGFDITLIDFNQAEYCRMTGTVNAITGAGAQFAEFIASTRLDGTARDALRFVSTSGNLTGSVRFLVLRG